MGVYSLDMTSGRPKGQGRQRVILNLPVELADEVRALADHERRTINSQVELLIERGLKTWARLDGVAA